MRMPLPVEIALSERPELLSLTSAQMAGTTARYEVLIRLANLNYQTASSVNSSIGSMVAATTGQ